MASNKYSTIGFIGLGVMGYPMCENLIKKVPETTKFYVFDVVESALERISSNHPERITRCGSSKEVAERSVCTRTFHSLITSRHKADASTRKS